MLISPPFLTDKHDEKDILEIGLQPVMAREATTLAPEGNYPVSQSFMWHTGLHLQAPKIADAGYAPVRAISDGKVVFVNQPRPKVEDPNDGQAYNPFGTAPSWSDNGMVVIEHTTDIGAEGDTITSVTFYSSYMHLSHIETAVVVGKSVYRKDKLGKPGTIYNHVGQIELSIACDRGNLQKLIRREPKWQDPKLIPTVDGRTDSIFGDMYFFLPASTPVVTTAARPNVHLRSAYQGTAVLSEAQWVRMGLGGSGVAPGTCVFSTYNTAGQLIGSRTSEMGAEYTLDEEAAARHRSAVQSGAARSSPSGWYELLRFGRNIGRNSADKDKLPDDAMHWRKIRTIGGMDVWADLNAEGTRKFSDADFLPVMGWNCYDDDDNPNDQKCTSDKLKSLIADPADPDSKNDLEQLAKRIGNQDVLPKLAQVICKFPNEWDKATLETRYKFMSDRPDIAENPASWNNAKKHLEAMGMDGLPGNFKNAEWHFHPSGFIRHFSKCGWLSKLELAQCFPCKQLHLHGTSFHEVSCRWPDAFARATRWALHFNNATRKYGLANTRQRLLHFFAHVIPETGYLTLMKESGGPAYLQAKSYYPYYGRGLIQLTWEETYRSYGNFRGFPHTIINGVYNEIGWDPDVYIARDNTDFNVANCADSAAYFVLYKRGLLKIMDNGIAQNDAIAASKAVNGGGSHIENLNGLDSRLQSILFLRDILLDRVAEAASETITFNWRRNSEKEPTEELDSHGHPKKKFFLRTPPWQISAPLDKQRPGA
jgi:predicted chitinase